MLNSPISVSISQTRGPEVITYNDVRLAIRLGLYEPFATFAYLAQMMYDISQRNGTLLADTKLNFQPSPEVTSRCSSEGPYSQECFLKTPDYAEEVLAAISCSDGPDQTNMTAGDFLEYWQSVQRESVYLGDRWAQNRLVCIFWKIRPKFIFSGMQVPSILSPLQT